ncbi:MAG: ChbG/HpnK family deacetylase [Acidobacteria bacterium]|nr:ChbG/HpnK family deacetylase [Acidobacteriota bacterium]
MKKLIVNADDFGFTSGVNTGILQAFHQGIVTSTTILANGVAFQEAAELARAHPVLAVGCHLSLVGGEPLAPPRRVASLVDGGGRMPGTLSRLIWKLMSGTIRADDMVCEFRAQLERVITAGVHPTHLDSHKHAHAHPRVMEALLRVADEAGIRCVRNPFEALRLPQFPESSAARGRRRIYLKQYAMAASLRPYAGRFRRAVAARGLRAPDFFCGMALTGLLDTAMMEAIVGSLPDGVTELACHPGVYDDALEAAPTRLKQERQRELEALTDPALQARIQQQGITLISYRELS